jgi:hypothetical protein
MASMVACAKPGGKVVIAVPNDESFVGTTVNNVLNLPPHHVTRWTPAALVYSLKKLGLKDIELWREPLMDYHEELFFHDLVLRALLNVRNAPLPFVRADLTFRFISKLARILARLLMRGNIPKRRIALGQTVMAVGVKD